MGKTISFTLGLCLALNAWAGLAADATENAGDTNTTVITSRHLDFDYPKRTAVFDGDVVVTDPRVTIKADSITALFSTNNQPETITAVGNVRIEQEGRLALSTRATYSVKSGLLVLTGRPRVMRGTDVLTGSRIIFSRDDDKVTCEDATLRLMPEQGGAGLDSMLKR
jgi:lipopolysaccharide transport protein LptA